MKENPVLEKSKIFSSRIVKLHTFLRDVKHERTISYQILRSGTSIGANISEAQCGISERDFAAKMYIAYKESNETKYWLELLHDSGYISDKQFESIYTDCIELIKLLTAITKSSKARKR